MLIDCVKRIHCSVLKVETGPEIWRVRATSVCIRSFHGLHHTGAGIGAGDPGEWRARCGANERGIPQKSGNVNSCNLKFNKLRYLREIIFVGVIADCVFDQKLKTFSNRFFKVA